MRNTLFVILIILVGESSCYAQISPRKVLVFSKTSTYYHESIPAGIAAIQKLGIANHFLVDTTTNAELFTDRNLKQYAALIFLSPSGHVLDTAQKVSLIRYIEAGGGYVGIHAASTIEKNWTWYGQLVGAVFTDHPEPQNGVILITDHQNPATIHLPAKWIRKDEWYNFRKVPTGVHVLFTVDETTYKGGKLGRVHPLAWYHEFDGGRAFYTAIGHFADSYSDPLQMGHILAGIEYAMGKNIVLDYSKAKIAPYDK